MEGIMKFPRRHFLHLAVGGISLPAVSRIGRAQSYPSRPVRLVVGFAAGGSTDIVARLIGQWLSERFGQQFIIENRPGAGTNIATEAVAHSPADGYTLLMVSPSHAINATLYDKLNHNFVRDLAPVASFIRVPLVMAVNPSVPAATVPEFIALSKRGSGKLTMASVGIGSSDHVAGELFKAMAGVDLLHVPYRGAGPALTDLLGEQVQVIFEPVPSIIEYIRTGKLRALAITTMARSEALPDVPSLSDFVPGYEASSWFGVAAPKATSAEIIGALNREINTVLADPKMKSRLAELGGTVLAGSPADFGKFIADETQKWAKVIKSSGAKAE
jgi:tripartite-type tricarboxylate transporter receptor subunit TctC